MKEIIGAILKLSDEEYNSFFSIAKLKSLEKGQMLMRSGENANKIFFLNSGSIRAYRNVDGVDFTHFFFTEQWFITDFKNYLTNNLSELNIVSLSRVSYYEIKKVDLDDLNLKYSKLEKLWKIVAERSYLFAVKRLESLQTKNLQLRYNELITQHPKLFLTFPQKHLASYLGVTEQSLSRIKQP